MEATASTTEAIEIRSSMKFLDTSPRGVLAGSALNVVRAASAWLRSLRKKRQPRDGAQKGSGDSGGGLKSLARRAKDEAQPSASGSNQLEP